MLFLINLILNANIWYKLMQNQIQCHFYKLKNFIESSFLYRKTIVSSSYYLIPGWLYDVER